MFDFQKALYGRASFRHPLRWILWYSIALNLLALAPVLHTTQIYDRILSSRSISTLAYLTFVILVCCAMIAITETLRQGIAQRLANRYAKEISEPLFAALASGRHTRGDQAVLLRDLSTVRSFLGSRTALTIFDVPFAIVFLASMFLLNPWLGLVTALGAAILAGLSFRNKRATADGRGAASQTQSEATSFAQIALQRSEDIRAMGLLGNVSTRWMRMQAKSINAGDEAFVEQSAHHGMGRFVRQALQIVIMSVAAYLVLIGDMSGGMIFAASILSGKAMQPIEQIIGAWDNIMQAHDAEMRIARALESSATKGVPVRLPEPKGIVTLEGVSYAPAGGNVPPILSDISYTFLPGQVAVIIGPSGAGKSTLARLLVGAITPTTGTIRIDGFKLDQWEEERRGKLLGYVPQDISLFPGTVAENIARLDLNPDSEAIIEAAKKAGVHELISRFPDGYNTRLGPGYHDISGGQRQRIALARAFYGKPKVLVLDEPNAHLDGQGEELLMQALAAARREGIAAIVISQRRSILQVADLILVMRDGKLEAMKAQRAGVEPTHLATAAQTAPAQTAPMKAAGTAAQSAPTPAPAADSSRAIPAAVHVEVVAAQTRDEHPVKTLAAKLAEGTPAPAAPPNVVRQRRQLLDKLQERSV